MRRQFHRSGTRVFDVAGIATLAVTISLATLGVTAAPVTGRVQTDDATPLPLTRHRQVVDQIRQSNNTENIDTVIAMHFLNC